jgi:hypothetical protein
LFDAKSGTVTSTSFRRGQKPDLETQSVAVTAYRDMTHNDKPARVRVTETRDDDNIITVEDVAPPSPADAAFRFRNQTRLIKLP